MTIQPTEVDALFVRIFANATSFNAVATQVEQRVASLNATLATIGTANVGAGFTSFLTNMVNTLSPKALRNVSKLTALIDQLGIVLTGIPTNAMNGINSVFSAVAVLPTVPLDNLDKVAKSIGNLAVGMARLSSAAIGNVNPYVSWINQFSGIDPDAAIKLQRAGHGVYSIGTFFKVLKSLGPAGFATSLVDSQKIVAWINQFSGTSMTAAATNVAKVGRGMSGMAKLLSAAGGTLPPITNNFNSFAAAAGGAAGKIGSLTGGLTNLFSSIRGVMGSFTAMRFSLLGIAGLGTVVFARFDDGLTRVMAHMEDWKQKSRPLFEKSLFDISGKSPTSGVNLTKGLDVLASVGMGPAMSVRALAIAESFAVASGMDMKEATQKLADSQWALGLASENSEMHLKNMLKLTDMYTGLAPRVGSSVEQLTEAMGSRFASAVRYHNINLEQAIALQGAYSLVGIRGSEASDRAARFLREMTKANVENYWTWKNLGVEVFDATGKLRPMADILENLEKVLGKLTPMQRAATEQILRLENRAFASIQPLIGMSGVVRGLTGEVGTLGGTTEKVAAMLRADFLNQMKILWNNVTNAANAVGKVLAPMIEWLGEKIKALTQWFTGLNPAFQRLIVVIALFVGSLFLLKPLLSSLLGPIITIGATLVTMMLNPITWLVGGLVFLGGALISVTVGFESFFKAVATASPLKALLMLLEMVATKLFGMKEGVAGFFWNFEENMTKLWPYIKSNWGTLLDDMFAAGVVVFQNIGKVIWEYMKFGFEQAKLVFDYFVNWLDVKFTIAALKLGEILSYHIQKGIAHGTAAGGEELIRLRKEHEGKMKGIEFLSKMMTEEIKVDSPYRNKVSLGEAMADQALKFAIKGTPGLLSGFVPKSPKMPDLNLKIPEDSPLDVMGKVGMALMKNLAGPFADMIPGEGWARKPYMPHMAEGDGEGTAIGKSGPGFSFKQISEARYMLGGDLAEKVDHQQLFTLRSISDKLTTLIGIHRGWIPVGKDEAKKVAVGAIAGPFGAFKMAE